VRKFFWQRRGEAPGEFALMAGNSSNDNLTLAKQLRKINQNTL
jgi:hypothetical protein